MRVSIAAAQNTLRSIAARNRARRSAHTSQSIGSENRASEPLQPLPSGNELSSQTIKDTSSATSATDGSPISPQSTSNQKPDIQDSAPIQTTSSQSVMIATPKKAARISMVRQAKHFDGQILWFTYEPALPTTVKTRGRDYIKKRNSRAGASSRGGAFTDPEFAAKAARKSWEVRRARAAGAAGRADKLGNAGSA